MTMNREFSDWLDTATRKLPAEVAASAREELTVHYEDAVEAHMESGASQSDAHQQAIRELGAPNLVANGLSDVHRGQKHYFWGMFASASVLIVLIGRIILHEALDLELFTAASNVFLGVGDVILTLITAYILMLLGRILSWRFNQTNVDRIITFLIAGQVLAIGCDVLYRSFAGSELDDLYVGSALGVFDADTLPAALLILGSGLGRIIMGTGIVLVGLRVREASAGLYGLGKPLAFLLFAMGAGLISTPLWTHLEWGFVVYLAEVVNILAHMLIWNLLILLFFRLAYRSPVNPQQFA